MRGDEKWVRVEDLEAWKAARHERALREREDARPPPWARAVITVVMVLVIAAYVLWSHS